MSESRKNHFTIDGGQETEEEHAASYKAIPESDTEFRPPSKASLSKSKEKVSADGAEEKLLSKEDEAKIAIRVDMAEAKYVVGDHRNGDAKIELDANKRQFSGLTKEELMKYADDPFWVRLRWFMFGLFWALWLCMLAGAIAIIIRAPKCYPPAPKTWFEEGPLADFTSEQPVDYELLESKLPLLEKAKVQGVFINPCEETYSVLDETSCLDKFKKFLQKAQEKSIKLIVDLTANYVPKTHEWFAKSENKTEEYKDFFVWGAGKEYVPDGSRPDVPNNWRSLRGEPAWSWSDNRKQYYLNQFGPDRPDLDFHNQRVVENFQAVMKKWMDAGAAGVRLHKARQLVVNSSLANETLSSSPSSATHTDYAYYNHKQTSDQPMLGNLLAAWAGLVTATGEDKVFTIYEDGILKPEWYVKKNSSILRPPSAAPLTLEPGLAPFAAQLQRLADNWTALQLTASESAANKELVKLAMLLPLTPLLTPDQLPDKEENATLPSERFSQLASVRMDASVKFGERLVQLLPSNGTNDTQFLVCARWKAGHTGYVAVFNSGEAARADLTAVALPSLPATLAIQHARHYNGTTTVRADDVLVPSLSTVVLTFVPKSVAEQ